MSLNLTVTGTDATASGVDVSSLFAGSGSNGSGASEAGAVVGTVVLGPGLGTAVGGLLGSISGMFGTGDVSPYQDMIVQETAAMVLDPTADRASAWLALAGFSGRYGAVALPPGGKLAVLQYLQGKRPDQSASLSATFGGATGPRSNLIGPLKRVGSDDKAFAVFQLINQHFNIQTPPANSYSTRSDGHIGNIDNPTVLPKLWPPSGASSALTTVAGKVSAAVSKGVSKEAGFGIVAGALLLLVWIGTHAHHGGK